MTDGQLLFVVVAALYLIECVRWLPANALACVEGEGGCWRFRRPSANLGARGGGALLLAPLPPYSAWVVTMPWVFIPARDHLLVRGSTGAAARIAWSKLDARADVRSIVIGGHAPVLMNCTAQAAEWTARLGEWRAMDEAGREKSFLALAARSLDSADFEKLASSLAARTRILHTTGGMIFICCFGLVSGVHAWFGEGPRLWIALGLLLALQLVQAFLFMRATRKAVPGGGRVSHRFWKMLSIALLPQHSARAGDLLCRAVAASHHPLAARGLLNESAFLEEARRCWRIASYEGGSHPDDALPVEAVALKRFFKSAGIDLASLEDVPARQAGSARWCPRCLAQFQATANECPDCPGVKLREFDSADDPPESRP
ncbi:MAG: hypothetical protein K1X78_26220 [Verrucomicrobiaceae bacterium]|nr:hypothetical protein [Verrucomicrobiaceae bacterium]